MLKKSLNANEKENKQRRQFLEAALEISEQERKKIAVNIHDDIGMALNVLKINLSKIARNPSNKEVIDEMIHFSNIIIDETISTVRSLSRDLLPPTFSK